MTEANVDRRNPPPLYRQIERILRGELTVGQGVTTARFTENGLMARFGVSRYTIRQALAQLSREGLVVRRQRSGTAPTIRRPIEQPLGGVYSFVGSMKERGLEASSRVVSVRAVQPDDTLREQLALAGATVAVLELVRVREANGEPVILESIWIPEELVPELAHADLTGSIYDLLRDRYGLMVTSAKETIRPVVLNAGQAQYLASDKGSPAFFVERVSQHGPDPIEVRHSVIRGDRYLYSVELRSNQEALGR